MPTCGLLPKPGASARWGLSWKTLYSTYDWSGAGQFVGDFPFDHDSALQADVQCDRIEPGGVGDLLRRGEIGLAVAR